MKERFRLRPALISHAAQQHMSYRIVRRSGTPLAFLIALLALACAGMAQTLAIDTAKSVMTIRVYKTGLLSTFGHDHEITAPIASGTVDAAAHRVELRVHTAALRVQDPNTAAKDREQVQMTMQSSQVLDAAQFPEIAFRASAAQPADPQSWTVQGDLTLHGQTHPVTVAVREEGGHYVGAAQFRQTEFGMMPVKVAGGTVKVKDQIRVEFDIQLVH